MDRVRKWWKLFGLLAVVGMGVLLPVGGIMSDRDFQHGTGIRGAVTSGGMVLVPSFAPLVLPRTRTVTLDGQDVSPIVSSAGRKFYFLNTLGSVTARFKLRSGVSFESGSGPLRFAPLGVRSGWKPVRSANSAAILYPDLYPGVDVALSPTATGVNFLFHRKNPGVQSRFNWRTPVGLSLPGSDDIGGQASMTGSVTPISRLADLKSQYSKVRADYADAGSRGIPDPAVIFSTIRSPSRGKPASVSFGRDRLVLNAHDSRWSGFSVDVPWSWLRDWADVPGVGPSKEGPGGTTQVLLDDGSTVYTGGAEPGTRALHSRLISRSGAVAVRVPQIAPAFKHSPMSPVCASDERLTILYGWNETDRLTEALREQIRDVIRDINGWIYAEDRSAGGTGARLKVQCVNGKISVWGFRAEGADTFSSIVSGAKAAGYDQGSSKYMIFWDSSTEKALGGEGASAIDSSKWKYNLNNAGARPGSSTGYAAVYAQDNRDGNWGIASNFGPYVPLHEILHSMGAVNPDAPAGSPVSRHCWMTLDVMCAGDAGLYHQFVQQCYKVTRLDCLKDNYFNPRPQPGDYLYDHWNLAGDENSFIARP